MLSIQTIVLAHGRQIDCFMAGFQVLREQVVFGPAFGHFYRFQVLYYFLLRVDQHGPASSLGPIWNGKRLAAFVTDGGHCFVRELSGRACLKPLIHWRAPHILNLFITGSEMRN